MFNHHAFSFGPWLMTAASAWLSLLSLLVHHSFPSSHPHIFSCKQSLVNAQLSFVFLETDRYVFIFIFSCDFSNC